MSVFGLYRHAATRPLLALSLLGLSWSLGCSSDGTTVPPPVVGSAGNTGTAGTSAANGGGSNAGGSSQSGGQAGTGNSGGAGGDASLSGGSSGDGGTAGDATAGSPNAGGSAGDAGSSGAGTSGNAGSGTGGTAGASGANPGGASSGGNNSAGNNSAGNSAGGTSAGGTSSGGTSAGGTSSGGTSAGGTSSGGTSAGGTSSGGNNSAGNNSGGSAGNITTLCGKTLQASDATELPISSAADDSFGGISSDERTIAWTAVANGTVTLWYADRASETSAFNTPKSLVIAATPDQVSISADGLRVAFVDADRLGFSEVTRGGFGDTFASAGSGDFAAFAAATAMLPAGESYGDPLFVSNGELFYYSRFGAGRTQTLFLTSRFSSFDPWLPGGQATLPAAVQGSGANRFHPSGVSADGYTLFGWSDATNSELALSLNQQTSDFDTYTDLGNRRNAAPNEDCTRLYYSAPGTSGTDLFVASVQ